MPVLKWYDKQHQGPGVPASVQYLDLEHVTNVTITVTHKGPRAQRRPVAAADEEDECEDSEDQCEDDDDDVEVEED